MPHNIVSHAIKATLLSFFVLGFGISSFISEIPALRDTFGYTPTQMGNLLLSAALGAFFVLPISGPLVAKYGPKRIGLIGTVTWATGITGILVAFTQMSTWLLVVSYICANLGAFLINAAINVEGGFVEVAARKPRMAWFHAAFSIGTVVGATVAVLTIWLSLGLFLHLLAVLCIALTLMLLALVFYLPPSEINKLQSRATVSEPAAATSALATWTEKRTLLIGLMVFGTGLMEGSALDWMALAVVDGFAVPAWYGTFTLALYLTALTLTRLVSPRLQGKYATDKLLRSLIAVGLFGVMLVSLTGIYQLALVGALLWGVGVALAYPLSASTLAKDPTRSAARLSVMSTIAFGSSIVGPAAIGYLAEYVGYQLALAIILIPGVVSLGLTTQLRPEGKHLKGEDTVNL